MVLGLEVAVRPRCKSDARIVGFVTEPAAERMNRTLLDGRFRVPGRRASYVEPSEIQRDLDRFLAC